MNPAVIIFIVIGVLVVGQIPLIIFLMRRDAKRENEWIAQNVPDFANAKFFARFTSLLEVRPGEGAEHTRIHRSYSSTVRTSRATMTTSGSVSRRDGASGHILILNDKFFFVPCQRLRGQLPLMEFDLNTWKFAQLNVYDRTEIEAAGNDGRKFYFRFNSSFMRGDFFTALPATSIAQPIV